MIITTLKKEVIERYMSPYFFETGTANGDAVRLALEVGFEKIFSVEIDENLYVENCEKFKKEIEEGRVFLFLGDTYHLLPQIIENHIDKQCTFWLDAHQDFGPGGVKRCPLLEELDHIKVKKDLNHIFLIDDRRMFGGDWWGAGITEEMIMKKIKEINSEYIINFEDGVQPKDVITAKL
jgi:hypothetical protein